MEADRFVRERGGRVYVWLQPVGEGFATVKAATKAPRVVAEFDVVHAGGFEFLLDRALERPKSVDVSIRRWPWKRVRVRGVGRDGVVVGTGDSAGVIWESERGGGGGGGGGDGGGGNGGGA